MRRLVPLFVLAPVAFSTPTAVAASPNLDHALASSASATTDGTRVFPPITTETWTYVAFVFCVVDNIL